MSRCATQGAGFEWRRRGNAAPPHRWWSARAPSRRYTSPSSLLPQQHEGEAGSSLILPSRMYLSTLNLSTLKRGRTYHLLSFNYCRFPYKALWAISRKTRPEFVLVEQSPPHVERHLTRTKKTMAEALRLPGGPLKPAGVAS